MTDKEKFIALFNSFGMEYKVYTDPEYIMENAIELGAVETICVREEIDIAFTAKGEMVGSYTNSSASWKGRK